MGVGEAGAGLGYRAGSAIRGAAIGDPDAAALRALNVPAKSPRVQSTLNAVEKSRPYLAGAKNLEDLQSSHSFPRRTKSGVRTSKAWKPLAIVPCRGQAE